MRRPNNLARRLEALAARLPEPPQDPHTRDEEALAQILYRRALDRASRFGGEMATTLAECREYAREGLRERRKARAKAEKENLP